MEYMQQPHAAQDSMQRTVDLQDENGRTALHISTECGHEDIVREILKAGANPNIRDAAGKLPLHMATMEGKIAMVQLLLEGGADACLGIST